MLQTITTTNRPLTRAERRERERLRAREEYCRNAARLFERMARQARKRVVEAQEDLADLEIAPLFNGADG